MSRSHVHRYRSETGKAGWTGNYSPSPHQISTSIQNFANYCLEKKVGPIFSTPYVPKRSMPNEQIDKYNRNIKSFHSALLKWGTFFPAHGSTVGIRKEIEARADGGILMLFVQPGIAAFTIDIESVGKMFEMPNPFVIQLRDGLLPAELLAGTGGNEADARLNGMVRKFAEAHASFIALGPKAGVDAVVEGMNAYLRLMGMQGKKVITDARFIYNDLPH